MTISPEMGPHPILQTIAGDDVDRNAEDCLELQLDVHHVDQVGAWRKVDQDVEVAALVVFASGRAAKDFWMGDAVPLQHVQQFTAVRDCETARGP